MNRYVRAVSSVRTGAPNQVQDWRRGRQEAGTSDLHSQNACGATQLTSKVGLIRRGSDRHGTKPTLTPPGFFFWSASVRVIRCGDGPSCWSLYFFALRYWRTKRCRVAIDRSCWGSINGRFGYQSGRHGTNLAVCLSTYRRATHVR